MGTILLAFLLAAADPIGTVRAPGSFVIHGRKTWGNATMIDGFGIQALLVPVEIRLRSGERWQLGAGAEGTVSKGRFVLQRGTARSADPIECKGALVVGGLAQVSVGADGRAQVIAAADNIKVSNPAAAVVRRASELPPLPGIAVELRDAGRRW